MRQEEGAAAGLVVELKAPEMAVLGLPVLVTLSISNRGRSPVTTSSRLNLMEGDVRLQITSPDGTTRQVSGAGGQPDTFLRQVVLPPGQQILGSLNLLCTDVGATFSESGNYILQAEYSPAPQMEWVKSAPVKLSVRSPQGEAEQRAAALLQKEEVRMALTLAEPDRAPTELRELAESFADRLEGKLARLILAGSSTAAADAADSNDIFPSADPTTTALLITCVSTPFSGVGKRLAKSYTTRIESEDTAAAAEAESEKGAKRARALRIIKGQPVEED